MESCRTWFFFHSKLCFQDSSTFLCGAVGHVFMTVIFYCMITHNEIIHLLLMSDCVVSSLAVTDWSERSCVHPLVHGNQSSSRVVVPRWGWLCLPQGHLAMFGDLFWLTHWEGGATGIWWVEAWDATSHPTIHRRAPQPRIVSPNVSMVLRLTNPAPG